MPEAAKRASVEATARSQAPTSWQPAAVAMPWTRAITGCGRLMSFSITSPQSANTGCASTGSLRAVQLLEVVARAERLARPCDDDHPYRFVAVEPCQLRREGLEQRVATVRCIAPGGSGSAS